MKLATWKIVYRVQTFQLKNSSYYLVKNVTYLNKSKRDCRMNTLSTCKHH